MIGVVIVGHGRLAEEYLLAIQHVMGKQEGICAISIAAECDRAGKQAEICKAADSVDEGEGVVVVTDMFGGSPSNLSMKACDCSDRRILYGANLPMLLKLVKSRGLPIERALNAAMDAGRKYINTCNGHAGI
ncbi:PTS fructose transporter subunit IIA [Amylibacter ulvae]|uniref:PTS fructose transporter subunit IIA n=1 Tax=Paramylibacter ulvae TaxID=1651968 RepID=A0ABQ3D9P3_9RHOB|nr:PTS fructose transporter subunit IIA [Amylibacter ulvae]GHA56829.1 PTS fructose transporter subunit IIA [Amylibacter ulvae]